MGGYLFLENRKNKINLEHSISEHNRFTGIAYVEYDRCEANVEKRQIMHHLPLT